MNSLLEVHLDQPMSHFAGQKARDASVGVGQEEDAALEDIRGSDTLPKQAHFDVDALIQQRIWDETFDDVVRKAETAPSQRPHEAEADVVETLNFEKSRVGLGDVYAKQYEVELLGHKSTGEEKE